MSNYNPFSLEGKRILVTGASSGIGRATAIECSRLGASLVITGRNEQRLNETFEALDPMGTHVQVIADLTVDEDIKRLVEECGKIEGCVLCAGRGYTMPFQFAGRDKFEEVFNPNFYSPVELLRLLFKGKKVNKGGSVVFIASIGGNLTFTPGNSVYGASKAAINSIMRFCAIEFAARGVRVNSICPGMVDTPLIHKGAITEEQMQEDMKKYPLKRYGKPEEIAYLAVYLLSDASAWMTGDSIQIDGGVSL